MATQFGFSMTSDTITDLYCMTLAQVSIVNSKVDIQLRHLLNIYNVNQRNVLHAEFNLKTALLPCYSESYASELITVKYFQF